MKLEKGNFIAAYDLNTIIFNDDTFRASGGTGLALSNNPKIYADCAW